MRSSRTNCSLAVEFSLVQENILLQNERITQLYIIQSEQDPFRWFGVLFVDSGIYQGVVVRFTMIIDDSYPNCTCPKIVFDPIPFHPLVDQESGELDTKNAFPDWNSNTYKLHQLLLFVKRVICQADLYIKQIQELIVLQEPVDLEAGRVSLEYDNNNALEQSKSQTQLKSDSKETKVIDQSTKSTRSYSSSLAELFVNFKNTSDVMRVYETDPDEFHSRVETFKQNCCRTLFDKPRGWGTDKNALIFTPWDPNVHETIRSSVLAGRFAPTSLFASYHKETDSVSFVPGTDSP